MIPNIIFQIMRMMMPGMPNIQNVKSPDDLAQQLLNSGRVNQQQVNQAKQMWNQPQIRDMVQKQFKF